MEEAYFAGGCFWCTEAIFQNLKGVTEVVLGYAGGTSDNPDYEEVSGGQSGHAETI
jgi:peptide-methionine (S)-S-oxide reductase